MFKLLLIIFFTLPSISYSFNAKKCDQGAGRSFLFGSLMSTTSFISSTGDCAMIGQTEHDQKLFLAINLEHVKLDSARGGGEFLKSYIHLGKLSEQEEELSIFKQIQKNYAFIFKDDDINAIYLRIKSIHG